MMIANKKRTSRNTDPSCVVAGTGLHTNIYFLTILLESVIHTEHL